MRLDDLCNALSITVICGSTGKEFCGVYAGDFLSRAMSHIDESNLWITIMSNTNVIAVASLTDAAAVILAEGEQLLPDAKNAAEENGVTVLSSEMSAYELCVAIGALTKQEL